MKEIEKRTTVNGREVAKLKKKLLETLPLEERITRTILIKTGEGFEPDVDDLLDIKIKLIDDTSILSVKKGSWHNDSKRLEYETRFERDDLAQLIHSLSLLSIDKFILLSTRRFVWHTSDCIITIDEYLHADSALVEVEAKDEHGEPSIDQTFHDLGLMPMGSPETIAFIKAINSSSDVRIDISKITPENLAERMLEAHKC